MSDKKYNEYVESGHATRWAAEALMGRCWLFYTGFYEKDSMPLAEGGSISKQQVIDWLNDCINNSGHKLVGDFRDLWAYTNEYTVDDYAYTKGVTGVDGKPPPLGRQWQRGRSFCSKIWQLRRLLLHKSRRILQPLPRLLWHC